MKKRLLPNGVVSLKPRVLKKKSKESVICYLRTISIQSDKHEIFISAMDRAKLEYFSMRELISKCKPSDVRGNLKSAQDQVIRLIKKLNSLDANSRLILGEVSEKGVIGLHEKSNSLLDVISSAYKVADSYQSKGRLIAYDKRQLVNSIADSIESILELPATSTKDSVLENCVAITLTDITGKPSDGIHTLIEQVIKDRKEYNS